LFQVNRQKEIKTLNLEEIKKIGLKIRRLISATTFIVTLSERGLLLMQENEVLYQDAEKMEVVDVCGAGDAVICIATLAGYKKFPSSEILKLCIKTGQIVCKKTGVVAIDIKEL
jgi:bifunctional ADP-heptose synthase (sugar kinase/adenylyltransferase)